MNYLDTKNKKFEEIMTGEKSKNREIKFRVFYKGKMEYPSVNPTKSNIQQVYFNDLPWESSIYGELMQYTNFRDKTGRDIYEGDIVFADDEKWEVVFDLTGFYVRLSPDDKITPLHEFPDCLVIGNIFENNELLG